MKISEILRRMLLPRVCLLCDETIDRDKEIPFCEDCEKEWDNFIEIRCNRCGRDRYSCSCLPALIKKNFDLASWAVFYDTESKEIANSLVFALKYQRYRDAIRFCTEIMRDMLLENCRKRGINYKEFAVTYTPRGSIKRRLYTYDQAREMAKYLAELLDIDFVEAFKNIGNKEQKRLSAIERRKNAQRSYVLKKNFENKHKKYFLVDDIMTTGSTLLYCSRLLISAGATEVIPVTYAKDNYKTKGDY
ncbi:MAG: ComF family protein [Clostridia bacterium]|nr:ComF family protein [Clostridia bacterium]